MSVKSKSDFQLMKLLGAVWYLFPGTLAQFCNREHSALGSCLWVSKTDLWFLFFILEMLKHIYSHSDTHHYGEADIFPPCGLYSYVMSVFSFQGDSVVLNRTMETSVTTPSSFKSAGRWGVVHLRPRACYLSLSPPPLTSRTQS